MPHVDLLQRSYDLKVNSTLDAPLNAELARNTFVSGGQA